MQRALIFTNPTPFVDAYEGHKGLFEQLHLPTFTYKYGSQNTGSSLAFTTTLDYIFHTGPVKLKALRTPVKYLSSLEPESCGGYLG